MHIIIHAKLIGGLSGARCRPRQSLHQRAVGVGYSGMLTGAAGLSRGIESKPPVLLIHGSADSVVPVSALHSAEAALKKLDVTVTTHVSSGLGHSVDPIGLKLGGEFVIKAFGR